MSASTNEMTTSEAMKTSGAAKTKASPPSLHGIDYQLKITLWSILIAKQNISNRKYSKCSITAEDPLGGKFDDTVMHFQLPNGSNQALYIQAKHKLDSEYKLSIADLTSTSASAFSVIKYFKSFCALHSQAKTDGAWFVLCTNAGVLEDVALVLENVVHSLTDDITAIFNRVKDAKVYRFHKERICNIEPLKRFFASSTIDNGLLDQFFGQFLLVSNMKGIEINADVSKLWHDMDVPGSSLVAQQMGLIEQAIALDHLSSVVWTMSNSSKTKSETDIDHIFQAIVRNLCFLQLKGTTSIYCKRFENSSIKIKSEALKQSKAYRACTTAGVHEYCALLNTEMSCNIIFQIVQLIECEYIFIDSQTYLKLAGVIRDIFCFLECNLVLVIVCEKDTTIITRSDEELFKDSVLNSKSVKKSVILITPSEDQNNEEMFRVSDLTEQAKQRIFKNYSQMKICYAHVSLVNLVFEEDNLAFVVGLIKTAESENSKTLPSIESFEKIKIFYIDRSWKISTIVDRDIYSRSNRYFWMNGFLLHRLSRFKLPMEFERTCSWLSSCFAGFYLRDIYDDHVIQQGVEKRYKPPPGMDTSDRLIIILEEAGFGKTTYMTFVAWYFVIHRQSSWVIRLNAIEYSLDFGQILKDHGPVLDENKAIRILFQLIYLALSISNLITKTTQETDAERTKAKRWAECLTLSEGKVVVNCARDATVEQQIALRVFKEKFNEKQIVLLLDGFDEIVPHYKQLVLNLFSRFAQFEGIHKLYFTSRPYNFIDELKKAFNVTNIYRIDPFSDQNQYEFLHRYLKCNFDGYETTIRDNSLQFSYLRKILLFILQFILDELHSIPLFFRMALDILTPRFRETINFIECTISSTLYQEVQTMFSRSRILEAFVNRKLAIANDKKFLSSDSATATAQAQLDAEKLNELTKNDLSLLAIYTIIPRDYQLLTSEEQQQCKRQMAKIIDGREKSGIVEGVQGGVPLFIHRMFAEYSAAYWLFKNRERHKVLLYYKSKSYWDRRNIEVRKMFDEIAIRGNDGNDSPVHLAILRNDKIKLKDSLTNNVHEQTDAIGRTPLHMAVQYINKMSFGEGAELEKVFLKVMNSPHSHLLIHAKDNLLHWSALDYAFRIENWEVINYLLKCNASINVTVLSEQLQKHDPKDACEALAKLDKLLMDLAHDIDECTPRSPHSTKQIENMRTVCNNVVTHIKNNHSAWFEEFKTDILLICAKRDSVLLLRSLLSSETDFLTPSNQALIITKALNECSFHILGLFVHELKIDISGMIDANNVDDLLKYCIAKEYKKWFSYIFNLYCVALNISGHTHWKACDSRKLELLFYAIERGSSEQVQHLIDGLLLTIDVGLVFAYLNHLSLDMYKRNYSFSEGLRYVLDRIENLYDSDEEGRNLLHRSAQLGLSRLVKWLIENKQFDPTTVNPRNNWNAFHYCVSIPSIYNYFKIGCVKSFEYMMQTKPINVNDAEGKNVFHLAVVNKHFSIAEHILDMVLVATSSENRSALQRSYIESSNVGGSIACTEFLEHYIIFGKYWQHITYG